MPLYSHCNTAACFIPQGSILREQPYILWAWSTKHLSRRKCQIKDYKLHGNRHSLTTATLHMYLLRYSVHVFTDTLCKRMYWELMYMYLLSYLAYVFARTLYAYSLRQCVFTETSVRVFTDTLHFLRHLCMYLLSYLAYVFTKTLYAYSLRHCVFTETSVRVFTDTLHLLRHLYMYLLSYLAYVFTKTLYAYSLSHSMYIWDTVYLLGHSVLVFTNTLCIYRDTLRVFNDTVLFTETLCSCIYWDISICIHRYNVNYWDTLYVYLLGHSI